MNTIVTIIDKPKQVNTIIKRIVEAGLDDVIKYMDYKHPDLSDDEKAKILREKWLPSLIEDGIKTGHFTMNNGRLQVIIQQELSVIAGFIYEAYVVRKAKVDSNFFFKLFKWTTRRERLQLEILNQYFPIGLGHKETREKYPLFYEPTSRKFDVIFLRFNDKVGAYEEATVVGTSIRAGVQVKAIKGNEIKEIISPILQDKYESVITMLRHKDNIHSYDYCMDIIKKMYNKSEITNEQRIKLENSIAYPGNMGIDQYEVDEYYDYIKYWYNSEATADKVTLNGVSIGVQEAILRKSILS
ncbi:hypothetical protein IAI10_10050 [Clostridium sp. 19966]|uniref:hypothetical protein n=1 Tax=Clostridium sp. 19966 TaxID=2768166 RepID=UPI0028DE968D|nr:hypothetical protein [Clostridium sp. 19966]MDT8717000.1 hypothetical protein [Clostridium sp. 19966]